MSMPFDQICGDACAEYYRPPIGVNMGGFPELLLNVGGFVGRPSLHASPISYLELSLVTAGSVTKRMLLLVCDPRTFSRVLAVSYRDHRYKQFLLLLNYRFTIVLPNFLSRRYYFIAVCFSGISVTFFVINKAIL